MKKTLLTTTALVALAGAATAEITVTGTARLGLQTTEGTAAVAAGTNGKATAQMVTDATAANGTTAVTGLTADTVATAAVMTALDNAIAASQIAAGNDTTAAAKKTQDLHTGTLEAIKAALT